VKDRRLHRLRHGVPLRRSRHDTIQGRAKPPLALKEIVGILQAQKETSLIARGKDGVKEGLAIAIETFNDMIAHILPLHSSPGSRRKPSIVKSG
jgi:hypothetical protein